MVGKNVEWPVGVALVEGRIVASSGAASGGGDALAAVVTASSTSAGGGVTVTTVVNGIATVVTRCGSEVIGFGSSFVALGSWTVTGRMGSVMLSGMIPVADDTVVAWDEESLTVNTTFVGSDEGTGSCIKNKIFLLLEIKEITS